MRLTIPRRALHHGLAVVTRAIAGGRTLPVLGNVLLESEGAGDLRLRATDLQMDIEHRASGAIVREPGAVTLPAKTLAEIVAAMPERDVALESDDAETVTLACDRARYRLPGIPAGEFPALWNDGAAPTISLAVDLLRRGMGATLAAAGRDETRPMLTGVHVRCDAQGMVFSATDTHRLHRICLPPVAGYEGSCLLPRRAVVELLRLLDEGEDARLGLGERSAVFQVHGTILATRLIDRSFPSVDRVIPKTSRTLLTLEWEPFQRAVKRARVIAREDGGRLTLRASGGALMIAAGGADAGSAMEEIDLVDRQGETAPFCLAADYLLDAAEALDAERFTMGITEPLAPVIMRPRDDERALVVLMPMRPAEETGTPIPE